MKRTGLRPFLRSSLTPSVLSISHHQQDQQDLKKMIDPAWSLIAVSSLKDGLVSLLKVRVAVVLCDELVQLGSWKDVLEITSGCPEPPHLIVTSRLADEALWAEALNLGAYDALAKPFEYEEVRRVVNGAWQNWVRNYETARFSKATRAFALSAALKSA